MVGSPTHLKNMQTVNVGFHVPKDRGEFFTKKKKVETTTDRKETKKITGVCLVITWVSTLKNWVVSPRINKGLATYLPGNRLRVWFYLWWTLQTQYNQASSTSGILEAFEITCDICDSWAVTKVSWWPHKARLVFQKKMEPCPENENTWQIAEKIHHLIWRCISFLLNWIFSI